MLSISVEKVWNDSDDIEGFRPSNVTIKVLANGEQYGDEIILTNETNWSYNVTGLTGATSYTFYVKTTNDTGTLSNSYPSGIAIKSPVGIKALECGESFTIILLCPSPDVITSAPPYTFIGYSCILEKSALISAPAAPGVSNFGNGLLLLFITFIVFI